VAGWTAVLLELGALIGCQGESSAYDAIESQWVNLLSVAIRINGGTKKTVSAAQHLCARFGNS
jgi:hypothetical protein